jgi:hypothetical protein
MFWRDIDEVKDNLYFAWILTCCGAFGGLWHFGMSWHSGVLRTDGVSESVRLDKDWQSEGVEDPEAGDKIPEFSITIDEGIHRWESRTGILEAMRRRDIDETTNFVDVDMLEEVACWGFTLDKRDKSLLASILDVSESQDEEPRQGGSEVARSPIELEDELMTERSLLWS